MNDLNVSWVYQNTLGVSYSKFKDFTLITNQNLSLISDLLQKIKTKTKVLARFEKLLITKPSKLQINSVMVSQFKYYLPIDIDDLI